MESFVFNWMFSVQFIIRRVNYCECDHKVSKETQIVDVVVLG